jgi:hypothetical protein
LLLFRGPLLLLLLLVVVVVFNSRLLPCSVHAAAAALQGAAPYFECNRP